MDCLFCRLIAGDVPATVVYEDDQVIAFDDINPQADIHKLIIPKKHISTINDLKGDDTLLIGQLVQTAKQLAQDLSCAEDGYRLVFNCNKDGGQLVYHIHLHLLAGRPMTWPPG